MSTFTRRATSRDIPGMVDLLLGDAERRRSLDPALWRLAADARARIESGLGRALAGADASARELWLLAEASGRPVGITHAMIVPAPPIYNVAAEPGLLLDDCFATPDAPPETAEALLIATEGALRDAGAGGLIASHPAAGPWRSLYQRHGYEPVTLYMARHGFLVDDLPSGVRPARAEDVPGIVKLSADHRSTLARLNPRFWPTHPDADRRFSVWMGYSLTLADRDMMVAGEPEEMHGYVIAQPVSPLLIPAVHELAAIGVVDDFYDKDFADVSIPGDSGATAVTLLAAAERALARRGSSSALVVCPAAWTSKAAVLESQGYRTAKVWMLKR